MLLIPVIYACSSPLQTTLLEGVLEGMSGGAPAATAADGVSSLGLRETARETLKFSGMGGAVFDGLPALEAVHFEEMAVASEGDSRDEV